MKKIVTLILIFCLILGCFSSCVKENEETASEIDRENIFPTAEPIDDTLISGEWGKSISYAKNIQNRVVTYYTDSDQTTYHLENMYVRADYNLSSNMNNYLTNIKSYSGNLYLNRALDVYYKDTEGNIHYADSSSEDARVNIWRLGYYYYNLHFLDQDFGATYKHSAENPVDLSEGFESFGVKNFKYENNVISYEIDGEDSYIYLKNDCISKTSGINGIELVIKAPGCSNASLGVIAGSYSDFNEAQTIPFSLYSNKDENTYVILFDDLADFYSDITGIRIEIEGNVGTTVEVSSIKFVKTTKQTDGLSLNHEFNLYSDKLNVIQKVYASKSTENVAEIGAITSIDESTVSKIILKDKNGLHDSLDDVDFESCEYVGFDIKETGIFGYILLPDDDYGKITVTNVDGEYIIMHTKAISGSSIKKLGHESIGERLYFDENHTFDDFLTEAEIERHPLDVSGDGYKYYDVERGAYAYTIKGTGFNSPFFTAWNQHYNVSPTIENNTDTPRKLYIFCATTNGCLENGVLLDESDMMLPISLEISKNFGGEDEEPLYYNGDYAYGETVFPLYLESSQTLKMKVLNLYQNWGNYPLKQLSSIQFFSPYYHFSTGVTETTCIAPWSDFRLRDFRPMSAPYWFEMEGEYYNNQPQHTHGGYQYFLEYTDSDGNEICTENIKNEIISSGPSYSEVNTYYITDDNNILCTYKLSEMPQTDEHRLYYEMTLEVLNDVSFNDFKNDVSLYSAYAYAGKYQTIGYLNKNNKCVTDSTNATENSTFITLGDECPYFALYNYEENSHNGSIDNGNNTNLSCSILDYDITVGGKEYTKNLVLCMQNSGAKLTLDLGKVTLKKGDTIKINMILSPWGDGNSTDDSNVQAIRENSTLNQLKAIPIDGELMDSVFVPKVKSVNGTSCEFTLTGGANNCVVRVYGFKNLGVPKIYEKIDGEYVLIDVSSSNNPDGNGVSHTYDGYTVYYDGDGTYSYAFVSERTGDRTFKIEVSD